jgi:hypothetical protein
MFDREDVLGVADQIVAWEIVAQQMPLPDLTNMLGNCQNDLAYALNAFQDLYDRADQVPADTLKEAIGAIARQATTTAIFALGLSQRAHQVAYQN